MIDICLSGLPSDRVLAYMDDVIICSTTFEEHLELIRSLLDKLRESGIQLKLSKCLFAHEEVDFLGYHISREGIKPQERLIAAVNRFKRPESKKELKGFLGLTGFYRNFIAKFSEISQPLNKLTNDNIEFKWSEECENSFLKLKELLSTYPVLAFPKIGGTFFVEVDASDHAIGGVLSQKNENGEMHLVSYFSTTLKGAQNNWSAHSKEAYAVVMATRNWYVYLAGTEFVIRSDHNPLQHLRNMKDPRGKFARWISELEEYSYTIEYIPGKLNVKADYLSRNCVPADVELPDSWEEKIYAVMSEGNFMAQLRHEQQEDLIVAATIRNLENDEPVTMGRLKRVAKQLRVEDGILTKSGRPVVPPTLRNYVTTKIHDIAHFGCHKLYEQLKERFYWPNMSKYATLYTSNCETCQKCKTENKPPKAPLTPLHVATRPMEFICIDIQHMPSDDCNYKYVLLIGDIFSKYIDAIPMTDQTSPQVLEALHNNWILKYGCPSFILSDQGSNVDGNLIQEVCKAFHIEKRRTTAYHSQGNGFPERNIRNIREILRTTLLSKSTPQKSWRKYLASVVFALNTSISKATKCIPYTVIFGRNPILPEDVFLGIHKRNSRCDVTSASEYANELKCILNEIYKQVNIQLDVTRTEMQRQYSKNVNFNNYKPSDRVWLKKKHYKPGESRKLTPRKTGPWIIIIKLPNGVCFQIENESNGKEEIVHHDRLTPVKNKMLQPERLNKLS